MRKKHGTNTEVEKFEYMKKGRKTQSCSGMPTMACNGQMGQRESCSGRPTMACSGHSNQRDPAAACQQWLAAARWIFPEIKELFTYRAVTGQQWLAAAAFDGFELFCIFCY